MSKQDKTFTRTASEVERKYNLGLLAQGGTGNDSERISQIVQELSEYKTKVNNLLKEIDDLIESNQQDFESHATDTSIHVSATDKNNLSTAYNHSKKTSGNPHNVTKEDVGLGNVDNTADEDKPVSTAQRQAIEAVGANFADHTDNKSNPHGVTKAQVGLGNVNNTADISKPVSTAQQTAIDTAYANANAYTDEKIAGLINGAPSTLDTLKEIADAMLGNEDVVEALEASIGTKANQTELDTHTGNSTIHVTASERSNWNTAHTHSQKTSGNPHGVTKSDVGLGNVDNTADANKKVLSATTLNGLTATVAELNYVDGVTSNIQAQLNTKVANAVEYYGDINELVTSGFYRVGTNANLPDTCQYGQIIVSRGSDTVTQICGSYYTGKIFTRGCNSPDNNPNWSEWIEYATKADLEGISVDGGGGFELSYEEENEALTLMVGSGDTSVWNLLTTKTGTTGQITLPTVFNELHIVIGTTNYMYTFNVLADYLSSTAMLFRNGYAISSSVFGDAYISVTKTAINAWTVRKEGVIQEATVKVYYK